jgi:hypothetical protein
VTNLVEDSIYKTILARNDKNGDAGKPLFYFKAVKYAGNEIHNWDPCADFENIFSDDRGKYVENYDYLAALLQPFVVKLDSIFILELLKTVEMVRECAASFDGNKDVLGVADSFERYFICI